ncbi:hypothetical protein SLEP1_g24179 [Rubroshorea leprosula]|uniref:Uncharacterized protein n=1 Tax=Rubroshorea leprosula TaxID=152421 RepID=A0AAV5JNG9_9ROSI|nr:hypothetical protein SLEP1_g24179 [Rubroshorea leprosula]
MESPNFGSQKYPKWVQLKSKESNRILVQVSPSFVPSSIDYSNWNIGDFFDGCAKKSDICNKNGKTEGFLRLI